VQQVSVGKISGAVGTYANVDPQVEQITMAILDLGSAPISTQVIQRDRHAEFMSALALLAATLEKIALQIRHYQRTEVLEAEEYFAPGQKGSSAMPHKRNPIISERICGQARIIRSNLMTAIENVALWHERDISHSSAERIILPDSTILLHYMLKKACWLIDKLNVYPENMAANLEKSYGLVYSQRVLLALVEAGILRDDAYKIVQRSAMRAWEQKTSFKELLAQDPEVTSRLSGEAFETLFEPDYQLRNMGVIFDRVAAIEW
jgi:adenylosuccinate lyase